MLKHKDKIVHDLHQLNLLNQNEVEVIKTTESTYRVLMIEMMVSENILNGDKNDLLKFTTYLKSYSDIKYFAQYWEKICKLSH